VTQVSGPVAYLVVWEQVPTAACSMSSIVCLSSFVTSTRLIVRCSGSLRTCPACSYMPGRPSPDSSRYRDHLSCGKKRKGSPYSIADRRVPELIPVLGSQPAGDVSNEPGGRLPLLSTRPAVTPATLKRAATSFPAW